MIFVLADNLLTSSDLKLINFLDILDVQRKLHVVHLLCVL